ncbi:MAG: flagellin [Acetobacteraceae bacterium]
MNLNATMTGATGYATLNRLIENSAATHRKLDRLANQTSTGLIGESYAALGNGAAISLDLRPQVANLHAWQSNIDAADGRMSVAQTALTQIGSIAAGFYAKLNDVDGIDVSAVDTIAASARDALGAVAGLLDSTNGGIYVFAGQDTANPPVPNPDNILTSGFYAQISGAVAALGVNGAAATANATMGIAISNVAGTSPFSTWLSQSSVTLRANPPIVQAGQNNLQTIGLPASANGLIPDLVSGPPSIPGGPPTTTGSYMRDVLRALATIGSLSSAQANLPGFRDLVQDTRMSLSGAVAAMAQDAGVLGNVQSSLTTTQQALGDTETALAGQVSSAEDVDMAAVLSQLSLVQTQMQASYQLIATLSGLSLTKYLPVGS